MNFQVFLAVILGVQVSCITARYSHLVLHDCGCWKDSYEERLIPDVDKFLYGHYRIREDAVQACASFARSKGYEVFALQDGGRCKTGPTADEDFQKLGPSFKCAKDGKGGVWANQVYRINFAYEINYRYVGCYKDDPEDPAVPSVEKRFVKLHDDPMERKRAIELCANSAIGLGYKVFAIQDGGRCMTSMDAGETHRKYGESCDCGDDFKGGENANSVYEITDGHRIQIFPLGCFKHNPDVIRSLEDTGAFDHNDRTMIIEDCIRYSASRGLETVGLTEGLCHGQKDVNLARLFNMPSRACWENGQGGPKAVQAYDIVLEAVVTIQYLGCWSDGNHHTIPSAEGRTEDLSDDFEKREQALEKCGGFAFSLGYDTFALQNGGMCLTAKDAGKTFSKLGPSEGCNGDEGGPWANSVWRILDITTMEPGIQYNKLNKLLILPH